jgi:ATP-dependent Zn protease
LSINAVDITAEVKQWLLAAFNSVIELLKDNRALLNKLAYALVE